MYSVFEEFPKGWGGGGGLKKHHENGKSWGVGGGSYVKFPPWWGCGYFLELHILYCPTFGKISTQPHR